MKKIICLLVFLATSLTGLAQTTDASYYLPDGHQYDSEIPTPQSILGFNVGDWHVSHDKLSEYMRVLASSSDRISIKNRGNTYEGRPLLLLTITSPKNHQNLECYQKNSICSTVRARKDKTSDLSAYACGCLSRFFYSWK